MQRHGPHSRATWQYSRRFLLTKAIEPPANVVERPCTIILAQDSNLDDITPKCGGNARPVQSWSEKFSQRFPVDYGIPVTEWSLGATTSVTSFDGALTEMKKDLVGSSIVQPIFVARGPWISWMVQFYLESLPLSALILVDPIPFGEDTEACRLYERQLKGQDKLDSSSCLNSRPVEYHLFQDYVEHADHWTLRIEPAVIPILVLTTIPSLREYGERTAARHSDDSMVVSVRQINDQEEVIPSIGRWILQEGII